MDIRKAPRREDAREDILYEFEVFQPKRKGFAGHKGSATPEKSMGVVWVMEDGLYLFSPSGETGMGIFQTFAEVFARLAG